MNAPLAHATPAAQSQAPLIAHVIYRLTIGGLENGLVNLINHLSRERYRHAIVCLTDYTDFHQRITRDDVDFYALHKKPGVDISLYPRIWRLFRRLHPAIVHTRNISAMEMQLPALLAGVPARVHSEHGREGADLDGRNHKYNLLRKLFRPLIQAYIPLSQDLQRWLQTEIGVSPGHMSQIYNGVDIARFNSAAASLEPFPVAGFLSPDSIVIGTVGRMAVVKDQLTLVRAFLQLLERDKNARQRLRLVMIGDGPLRAEALGLLEAAGAAHLAWVPGDRDDIPALLRVFDIFVLPSLGEGISNTILEAMASGLPVVATRVGGNPELVQDGVTGRLVPSADPAAMAEALSELLAQPELLARFGTAGRERAVQEFSIEHMVERYSQVYDALLRGGKPMHALGADR
jgi:sugar transferase (PEP-CTERM/EpsH1 system associated)